MLRSIFMKEFYKIRWLVFMVLIANVIVSGYVFIETRRLFILDHPEIVWYRVLHLGQINYDLLKFVPLITGIVIAVIQYLPEMMQQRMRLALHLPITIHGLIFMHLLIGLVAFSLSVLPDIAVLIWTTRLYFPTETFTTVFLTTAPWFFAGVSAYLGGTLVLLEPGYKRKTVNMIVSSCVAGLFLLGTGPGQYGIVLPFFVLPLLLLVPSSLLPAYRFRFRRVA